MQTKNINNHVVDFIPEDRTDFHSIRNMTQAMFKLNNGTIFTSRTASQFVREQFGINVDYHIMVEILESLERLEVLKYDGVDKTGCQRYMMIK